jgi:hypothetical protein
MNKKGYSFSTLKTELRNGGLAFILMRDLTKIEREKFLREENE